MGTFIVCAVLVVIVAFAVRSIYKKRKSGSCSCGGSCGSCGGCSACNTK
ncbi:MAG: FeoB-associated Cys-rich membrane protein [Lachnospiraceae bacterium]|nr:FeoB-associated Cys-rich membrane protein [Lachnospiraceae bacterium]